MPSIVPVITAVVISPNVRPMELVALLSLSYPGSSMSSANGGSLSLSSARHPLWKTHFVRRIHDAEV